MDNTKNGVKRGGFSICTIVGLLFIVMKVFGLGIVANWSWIWVLSPFWIGYSIVFIILIIWVILIAILS